MTHDTITDPDRQGLDPEAVWTDDYVRTELWGNVYGDPLPTDATPDPDALDLKTCPLTVWLAAACDTILDVGCGWMGYDAPGDVAVTGADISPAMIELGEAVHPDREFVHASAFDLPSPDGHFGGVRSTGMLRHIEDWDAALAELVRVADRRVAFTHLTADEPEQCGPYQWCVPREAVLDALPAGAAVDVETYKAKDHRQFESTLFMVQL